MAELPLIGVTAVIAGMSLFNQNAAQVETRLLRINSITNQMAAESAAANVGVAASFAAVASAVATGSVLAAGAVGLAAGAAIKFAADFEQSLALTRALSPASADLDKNMGLLKTTIQELSRTGTLGMSDLADATTELARSGVPIPDILNHALKATRDLAQASGGELGLKDAADLVSNSVHAFGLEFSDSNLIVQAATALAQNSTATFTGFGQGVAIAGASFRAAGFDIKDFAIAETILTRNGMSATVAATALRGVIQRLEKPSKDAAKVMTEYGIHLFDAAGKGVGLRAVIGQLNAAFSDEAVASGKVTEEARAQALATLGLQRTSVAMFNLAVQGTEAYDELSIAFDRATASTIIEELLKPLNAQMQIGVNNVLVLAEAFGNKFVKAMELSSGGIVQFLQHIRTSTMGDFAQSVLDAGHSVAVTIGGMIDTVKRFVTQTIGADAAGQLLKTTLVGVGVVVLSILIPPILSAVAAFGMFFLIVGVVATAIEKVSGFVADSATAIANWAQDLGLGGAIVADAFRVVSDAALAVGALLRGDFASAGAFAQLAVHDFADGLNQEGGKALQMVADKLVETGAAWAPWAAQAGPAGVVVGNAITGVSQVVEGLQFLLQGNFAAAAEDGRKALDSFGKAAQPIVDAINGALKTALNWLTETAWPAVSKAIKDAANYFLFTLVPAIISTVGWINTVLIPAIQDLIKKINDDLKPAVEWATNEGFPNMKTAAVEASGKIKDLADNIGTAAKVMGDRGTLDSFMHGLQQLGEAAARITLLPLMIGIELTKAAILKIISPFESGAAGAYAFGVGVDSLAKVFDFVATKINDFSKVVADVVVFVGAEIALLVTNFKGFSTQVNDAIGNALKPIQQFGPQVEAILKNAGLIISAVALALGSNLANSFARGITNAISAVAAAATSLVNSALNAARNALPGGAPHSPWPAFVELGSNIGDGLASGIAGGAVAVNAVVTSVMVGVLAAARDAVHASSPSRDFEVLGQDMGEGLDLGLLSAIPKVKDTAKTYGDTILAEMATFTQNIETASRDIGAKLEDIATKVGDSITGIIQKSQFDQATAINSTQDALDRLGGTQARPDSNAAAERDLQVGITAEKLAHQLKKQDDEADFQHTRSLKNAEIAYNKAVSAEGLNNDQAVAKAKLKLDQDLEDATTDKKRAEIRDRYEDALETQRVTHHDKINDLGQQRILNINAINERAEDAAAERVRQRAIDADERQFQKDEEAKITAFKQQTLNDQRDAKIRAIQEAENTNTAKVGTEADKQRVLLLRGYTGRISDLKDALLDKIPPLEGDALVALNTFMDNVSIQTDATAQAILDSFGTKITTEVAGVGTVATNTLGTGGIIPVASAVTVGSFGDATDAAGDLRGDSANGLLGAKDAATQISFVLQQLDEKMPHLVQGVKDLVSAIDMLHDKTVTITVNQEGGPASGGTANSVLNQALANPGASGPGGSFDAIRNSHLLTMGEGGVVPGPYGHPVLAIVHGGEFVAAMGTEAAKWARQAAQYQPQVNREYNYNVNASYANTQSPASVELDMRALVALSRGS